MKNNKLLISTLFVCLLSITYLSAGQPIAQAESNHDHEEHEQSEKLDDLFEDAEGDHGGHDHDEHTEEVDHDDRDAHDEDGENTRDDHEGEDDHSDEGEDDHSDEAMQFSAAELKEFGIELAIASTGTLNRYAELPGEIVLNADRLAHVVPRVSGLVRKVNKSLGDQVQAGSVMALIESRELATAKAEYLAAVEREKLANANFEREERLWQKKVTSEQEYLDARQALAEAGIERKSAEQQLHALGFSDAYLKDLPQHPDATYTHYQIRAPFSGTVIEKHLTLGESVGAETAIFTLADLSTVWVDINVYQKDLANIRKGQSVAIQIGHGISDTSGQIAWVGPLVGEETRTAKARIVLPNPDGSLRPGLFVTAQVAIDSSATGIVIPKSALQTFEEKTVIFIQDEDGFEPVAVQTGRQNAVQIEILSGLEAGQTYVSKGAFTLKAQMGKAAFDDGHNH